MKVTKTKFEELLIIEPSLYVDKRGSFYESWRKEDYKQIGIDQEFLQDDVSVSYKNVLRGLHLQKAQGKLVTVVYGKIFDVVVDLRATSKTYQQYFSIELSTENPKQLYVPPGFAHGFCVLSDITIMNYKCTQYYDASSEESFRWDDPRFNIDWPGNHFILSEKDKK